jgi:hypothetical protein
MTGTTPILNPYGDLHRELSLLGIPTAAMSDLRRKLVAAYAWAIPSPLALETIARYQPLIELGAGTGYWAFCLRQMGVDITAMDRNEKAPPQWSAVVHGDESLLEDASSPLHQKSLMLCWPPLSELLAERALQLYRGDTVIDIGEPRGGNTGTPAFADNLEANFSLVESLSLPRWPGCRDELRVWVRN